MSANRYRIELEDGDGMPGQWTQHLDVIEAMHPGTQARAWRVVDAEPRQAKTWYRGCHLEELPIEGGTIRIEDAPGSNNFDMLSRKAETVTEL